MATTLPSDDHLSHRDRPGLLALILGALAALGPLTIDMYLPSLPSIERDLRTTASMTQLTLASYFAGLGIGQLGYGPLTDRFGRKRPLYFGLTLYVLASAGCALAPNAETLIALRFLQALGGAAGPVVMRAVVRDLYVGPAAARLLSMLILVMGAAPILAPLLGGFTLEIAGWRTIFAVLTVLGAACLALMATALPETSTTRTRIEVRSLARNVRALLGHRAFVAHTLTGAFSQAGMFAYISGSPFVLIELFHVSPQRYGWFFGANAVGFIAASQVNHRLLARFSPGQLLARGTVAAASMGAVLVAIAVTGAGGLPAVAVSLFGFMASIGFIGPNATALAMDEQGDRAGLASALLGSIQFGIAACASSLVGVLNDGSMRPMAGVMAACGVASFLAGFLARR
ncbi:Bcr/CflA family multidrug efflux MFS transporter [Polyangium sp. y55x31]|uniref:Bcr/CflA family multidrug efflux MFS transporter n=1 Tax=Polyangium sp. y55x31 TaxID=3042688 RepID=UPI002482C335|nr:Bcr/CflA family multidrug efflux MFS transporter [Polyangium sp. y55x31]MDI1481189.1 Bcr/CflA family multidrug efflux MFS transporter [Polyangium sp. y55x31]